MKKLAMSMKKLLSNTVVIDFDAVQTELYKYGFHHDGDCMVKGNLLICFDAIYNGYHIDIINAKNDKYVIKPFRTKNAYL